MKHISTKHLNNIASILKSFIKKWNCDPYYVSISGDITNKTHGKLNITPAHCFDALKISDFNNLKLLLYEDIRKYLDNNKIKQTIYIETTQSNKYVIGYKTQLYI